MARFPTFPRPRFAAVLLGCGLAASFLLAGTARAQENQPKLLRIGATKALGGGMNAQREKAALDSLKSFIKDETGFDNEIVRVKDWKQLSDELTRGDVQLGVFQGQSFAWAQEKNANLKPLALAVNIYTYPVAYVITRKDDAAKDFAGLQGKSLSIPGTSPGFGLYFAKHECQGLGKTVEKFFSAVTYPENIEDALDDVVDGKVGATVVDRAGLEAFKQRKPGRFKQLRPVVQSRPVPPPVIAYEEGKLDKATLQRFRTGLLNANQKERGQTLLTLFHLSGFQPVPADFEKVVAQTRKTYPPLEDHGK